MRNLLIKIALFAFLIPSLANAKTEGNYVGIDLINSRTDHYSGIDYGVKDENQLSLSLNYKYGLNYNTFFVMPNVFLDYTNLTAKDRNRNDWDFNYRYGVKFDVGFDLTDKFAAFGSLGLAATDYKIDLKNTSQKSSGTAISPLLGFGVKYSINESFDLNAAYDVSVLELDGVQNDKQKFYLDVFKIGFAYRF